MYRKDIGMKRYTVNVVGRKTFYARDPEHAIEGMEEFFNFIHPSLEMRVESVELNELWKEDLKSLNTNGLMK